MEVESGALIAAAIAGPVAGVVSLILQLVEKLRTWNGTPLEKALAQQLERQDARIGSALDRFADQNDRLLDVLTGSNDLGE